MADLNIPSRAPQVNATRPAGQVARPAGAAPSGNSDQVTLSDAAQKAQAESQPRPEPAPEKKGFWRSVLDFVTAGPRAQMRLDVMYQVNQMGLDAANVDKNGIYHHPKAK